MITFRKILASSSGAKVRAYFTEHNAGTEAEGKLTAYYAGTGGMGRWRVDMPRPVADALGVDAGMRPKGVQLDRLFKAQRADNGEAWTPHPRTNSAIDFCFGLPKPVTLAIEFEENPAAREMLITAGDRTNDKAMRFIAADLAWARLGKGGEEGAEPAAAGWWTVRHNQARATLQVRDGADGITYLAELAAPGDPHTHWHNPFWNLCVVPETGRIGSLDTQRLTDVRVKLYGAYAQAVLAQELRDIGVAGIGVNARGDAVTIEAVPDAAIALFSKGRRQTERNAKRAAQRQGLRWSDLPAERKFGFLHDAALRERLSKAARTGANAEGLTAHEVWRLQAQAIGWKHVSPMVGAQYPKLSDAERYEAAYAFAARHLAAEFRNNAVLDRDWMSVWAARGLIGVGIKGPADIHRVVRLLEERGIEFRGERAFIRPGLVDGRLRIANTVQIALERRVAELSAQAAADRSQALAPEDFAAALARTGRDWYGDAHGRAQAAAGFAMATGGALTYLTGAAGSGKSTMLEPLVDAYQRAGFTVSGCSTGWLQATEMREAGIARTWAVDPLLRAIDSGEFRPDRNTVLIVEEMSQVGVAELARMLEFQAQTGFVMHCIGDRKQCDTISAGSSVEVLERALPEDARPKLTSVIRQKRAEDREVANLFRAGEAGLALDRKRAAGTARMLGGDRGEVVDGIADFLIARRDILLAAGFKKGVGCSAPTNADAAEISAAVREKLKVRGEVDENERVFRAQDQRGEHYDLPLAAGDRVRLFRKTWGILDGERGWVGSNGDVLTVERVHDAGLVARDRKDRIAVIEWRRLAAPDGDRILLGHGWAQTIDAIQGATLDEHVNALPGGTAAINKYKGYVAETRAQWTTWTLVGEAGVFESVRQRRALGDETPITSEDLWAQVAKDFANAPPRRLGMDVADAAREGAEQARSALLEIERVLEGARAAGHDFGDEHQERLRAEAARKASVAAIRAAAVSLSP